MNGLSKGQTFSPVLLLACRFPCSGSVDSSLAESIFHAGIVSDLKGAPSGWMVLTPNTMGPPFSTSRRFL